MSSAKSVFRKGWIITMLVLESSEKMMVRTTDATTWGR